MLTLESFEEAAAKVKEVTQETKLIYSSYFSDMTGNKVYLKPENMQRTGAYKVQSNSPGRNRVSGLIKVTINSATTRGTSMG